jgi:hypothetical protein
VLSRKHARASLCLGRMGRGKKGVDLLYGCSAVALAFAFLMVATPVRAQVQVEPRAAMKVDLATFSTATSLPNYMLPINFALVAAVLRTRSRRRRRFSRALLATAALGGSSTAYANPIAVNVSGIA